MWVQHSANSRPLAKHRDHAAATEQITEAQLRETVERISIPRSYYFERTENQAVAEWIADQFAAYGLEPQFHGRYANVVAATPACRRRAGVLIGAHYDSAPGSPRGGQVTGCPGADDNASAVAAMLACAQRVAHQFPDLPFCFVAFNCEEDDLLGSVDFVENYLAENPIRLKAAHVLEMVGYCDHRSGSQKVPRELPIRIPDVGNFLGIIANRRSARLASRILSVAKSYLDDFPVMSLKAILGLEHLFPVLKRSDHAAFWRKKKIPAVMWTDTSEYRNPHYHRRTDTPDTLDYAFLRSVAQLLLLSSLTAVG
ncbi:MAG: M28 family peptidase [bacterium]|nr:M28 family peptidase [bacterium]